MTNILIEMIDVNKTIKNVQILKDINLSISEGEIYGFVGRNASGKSMLFKCITNLVKITSGEIKVFGKVLSCNQNANQYIGALIEYPSFLGNFSGFENLKLLNGIRNKVTEDELRNTMEQLELDPLDKKKFANYSLGMRQKLGIVAAIMEKPKIVVLDEPTNNIDATSVDNVREVLRSLNKNHTTTILLASHHIDDIKSLCTEVFTIENGKLRR